MSALSDALDRKTVRALSLRLGGRQIRVPGMGNDSASVRGRERLVALVGINLAQDLVTHFAKTRLYVPRGPSDRNARGKGISVSHVVRLTRKGWTAARIADNLGCSERTVYLKRAMSARLSRKDRT